MGSDHRIVVSKVKVSLSDNGKSERLVRYDWSIKQIFNKTNLQFIFINQLIGQNIINTLLLI